MGGRVVVAALQIHFYNIYIKAHINKCSYLHLRLLCLYKYNLFNYYY